MKNNLPIKTILKSVIVLGIFTFFANVLANWSGPTMPMPGGNVSSPIHIGVNLQEKLEGLIVRGFRVLDPDTNPSLMNNTLSVFDGQIQLKGGNPDLNKILASNDLTGIASWKTLAELGGGGGSGMINPMTTLGDMIYGLAGGTPQRLGIGQPSQILKVVNGLPSWQTPPPAGSNGWTDDGAVVRLTTATDKVGIGFSPEDPLPTEQLNLTGNFKMPETVGYPSQIGIIRSPDGTEDPIEFLHNNGNFSTFLGYSAGGTSLIVYNSVTGTTLIGRYTNTTSNNVSVLGGYNSGRANDTGVGSSGGSTAEGDNVYIGRGSLDNFYQIGYPYSEEYDGHRNAAFGDKSMSTFTFDGVFVDNNVSVGAKTMQDYYFGSNSIALGFQAAGNGDVGNSAAIGANTTVNASNTMVFGSSSVTGWGFGTQPGGDAIKASNGARLTQGGTWTDASDRNKKYDIFNTKYGLNEILALRPVDYKTKANNEQSVGFIAQEVKEIIPELVYGEEGDMTLSYSHMTAILTKAVQELKSENDLLKEMTAILEAEAKKQGY